MKISIKILHWTPRVLCILAILFISMFALDAFEGNAGFWQKIGDFLIHLIPTYVLIAALIVAWKWELIGGIIYCLIGLGFAPFIYLLNHNRNHSSVGQSLLNALIITVPFIIVGILFLVSFYYKKKTNPSI